MKLKIFSIIFVLLFLLNNSVFAILDKSKGKALESFTKKQYDLIFESNLGGISNEYSDIFSISKKADIFDTMTSSAKTDRLKTQNNLNNLISKIDSLEEAIKIIDNDITDMMNEVKDVTINISTSRKKIEENSIQIDILRKKIEKNKSILLYYLDYIYKKQNTAYDKGEIDNIKSILLNDENISDILNDLYYNSVIQIAGKQLIDNHKKFIADLYIKKINLEKEKNSLALLRKKLIISTKKLKDKRNFKERILEASKGKQKYYKKFLDKQINIENNIRKIAIKEKIKLSVIKQNILKKYKCKFVDLGKNTSEARSLQLNNQKCYNINKMIYSEGKLSKESKLNSGDSRNIMSWPVNPYRGITAFFKDEGYKKEVGAEHNAIDIRTTQGTPVEAPMDGYVIYIQKPVSQDYSFVAIKHYDGYITVYGHLSEVLVDKYDYIEKGEIFAKSGGEFGTNGAGYITSGAHLHFEVFRDKKYIDPLSILDLSYLDYNNLLPKYKLKYLFDFKKRKGYDYDQVNKNTKMFKLVGEDEIERQKYLISKYANSAFNNWQMWIDESLAGNIDPSLTMCIGLAESGLGTNLTTRFNIGNVGNNDRGDRVGYNSPREGVAAIIYTLNNRYHKNVKRLDMLSGAGRLQSNLPSCKEKGQYCYATDTRHWHPNVVKCLSHLKGYLIPDDYNFRVLK